jgi:hypothetical protein
VAARRGAAEEGPISSTTDAFPITKAVGGCGMHAGREEARWRGGAADLDDEQETSRGERITRGNRASSVVLE